MQAVEKRTVELSSVHDRRKRADAGFLDSRDLDGRPADEYGLDWLRQQGTPTPLPMHGGPALCFPSCTTFPQPFAFPLDLCCLLCQRMQYGGVRRRYGRRTAASGGCERAVRWRRARPPLMRHSLSEQLSTGKLSRGCVPHVSLSEAVLSLQRTGRPCLGVNLVTKP